MDDYESTIPKRLDRPMIVRGPRRADHFTILPNGLLRDTKLSYRARGIAAACLSQPPGYRVRSEQLADEGKEGREAIRAALRELESAGYLVREKVRGEDGKFSTEAVLYDEIPTTGNPSSVPPALSRKSPGHTRDGFLGPIKSTNEGLKERDFPKNRKLLTAEGETVDTRPLAERHQNAVKDRPDPFVVPPPGGFAALRALVVTPLEDDSEATG